MFVMQLVVVAVHCIHFSYLYRSLPLLFSLPPPCLPHAIHTLTHCSVPGGDTAGGVASSLRPLNGYTYSKPEPLARAPDNVFVFRGKQGEVLGWRNVFDLPIEYDVELCPGLLKPDSATLSCRFLPEGGPRRRFIVIGERYVINTLEARDAFAAGVGGLFFCRGGWVSPGFIKIMVRIESRVEA